MCYTRRKIEGGVVALRESDDTNFLKPNDQSQPQYLWWGIFNIPLLIDIQICLIFL